MEFWDQGGRGHLRARLRVLGCLLFVFHAVYVREECVWRH
jgi:hypothetical protein